MPNPAKRMWGREARERERGREGGPSGILSGE